MKKVKYLSLVILTISMTFLSACDIQIFEDKNAKYQLVEMSKDELETNVYYVKDGTKFYEVHNCEASDSSTDLDVTKTAWTILDGEKIPSFYKGELIAYASDSAEMMSVPLERYQDTGYSFGIYGAEYLDDGYISFEYGMDVIRKTSAYKALKNDKSQNILIETINGKPVTKNMINSAGVFVGLERDKEYDVTFYAGTYYGTVTMVADTHFYQSYEAYILDDFEMTKNGYVSIYLPEDLKTGYYRIDGAGMFKYYSFKKGEADETAQNMNEAFYTSEEEQLSAYSQQFTFNMSAATPEVSIVATYNPNTLTNENTVIKMMVTSPDGKKIIVSGDKDTNQIVCDMDVTMAGKWIVNISPQSLKVDDVEIVSNSPEQEFEKEVYNIAIDSDKTGIIFYVDYEGEGIVTAQVVDSDNKSYDMTADDVVEKRLVYNFSYLPAGAYQINVYHHPDTKIKDASYDYDENVKEVEIITVEE